MSYPPNQGQDSPWSQPDPSWRPSQFQEAAGRDPRQPFGAQPSTNQPHPSVQQFQPPKPDRRRTWLILALVVVVVVGFIAALQLVGQGSEPAASESTSTEPATQASDQPTAVDTSGTSIPFDGHGTGTFEIVNQSWSDNLLTVDIKVSMDAGTRSFEVYMFNNETMDAYESIESSYFTATGDEPYKGTIQFAVAPAPGTLILASDYGKPLAALALNP